MRKKMRFHKHNAESDESLRLTYEIIHDIQCQIDKLADKLGISIDTSEVSDALKEDVIDDSND